MFNSMSDSFLDLCCCGLGGLLLLMFLLIPRLNSTQGESSGGLKPVIVVDFHFPMGGEWDTGDGWDYFKRVFGLHIVSSSGLSFDFDNDFNGEDGFEGKGISRDNFKDNSSLFFLRDKTGGENVCTVAISKGTITILRMQTHYWKFSIEMLMSENDIPAEGVEFAMTVDVEAENTSLSFLLDMWYACEENVEPVNTEGMKKTIKDDTIDIFRETILTTQCTVSCFSGQSEKSLKNIEKQETYAVVTLREIAVKNKKTKTVSKNSLPQNQETAHFKEFFQGKGVMQEDNMATYAIFFRIEKTNAGIQIQPGSLFFGPAWMYDDTVSEAPVPDFVTL